MLDLQHVRILAGDGESRERRRQATHPARVKPELCAAAPNQVWSWTLNCPGFELPRGDSVLLAQLGDAIKDSDSLSGAKRGELAGQLRAQPGLRRFLRQTPSGLLRIGRGSLRREERLDGKFLLRTSDPTLTPETSRWATSSCWRSSAPGGT